MARLPSFRRWFVPVAVLLAAVRCGGGGDLTLPDDKLPATLTVESGNAQQGTVGLPLTDTLIVRITDSKSRPVQTARVVFQLIAGGTGGDVIPDTAVTDIDGRARSRWVLGQLAGAQRVDARVLGQVSGNRSLTATFTATGLAGAPDTVLAVLGVGQSGAVGSTLTDSLAVLVTDRYHNPIAGQTVNWAVPVGQGSVSAASVVTGADGRAAVQRRLGLTAGTQTATATVAGVKGSPLTFTSTATAGGATRAVKLFGDTQTAPAGFQLTDSVVVQVQDANGNGVPGRNVNWVVTDGGSVTPLTSTTDAQGKAFAYWTLKPTAGANQLTAAASGLAQLTFTATGTSATPSQIVAQSPTSLAGTAGLSVAQKPSVKVTDANSNPVQGVTVLFQVTAGGGSVADPNGSGSSVSVATGANGIATLTDWTLGTVAGVANTVTATASGTGISNNPISFNATAAAGAATRLHVATQPSASAQSGVVFGQQPAVQLQDPFGNTVTQSNVQVTAAVVGPGATLRGTTTVGTSAAGTASFSNLNLFGAAGAYRIVFSAGALAMDTTNVVALTAGAAAKLVLTTQPAASAQNGAVFATQPVVQVEDSAGNAVAANGLSVTATIATGAGTLGGTTTIQTGANGSAAYTDLFIAGPAGARTLAFSATGLTPAVSGSITVGAGAASKLAVTTQPSASAQSGSVFAQQPVITLQDATGNTVPQSGVTITATVTGAPAGVSLGGTASVVTTASGTASFTGLSLSGPSGNYTLTFSVTAGATGVTSATSTSIALAAGSGTALTITTQPPATGQSGVALAPAVVIQLRDGVGNAVSQAGVAIGATIATGASGTLAGTDTVLTAANGTATFSNLIINGAVGSYTLAFGGSGLSGVTATPTTIAAGPAAKLALLTQPAATAQSGIILTTQPVLQLQDAAGNPVNQAGTVVTAAIGTGGGTLGGTLTATTGANGQASFTDLAISGTVGVRTLAFSAPTLTGVSSANITLGAGAAAQMTKVAGDGQSATAGSPVAINPQVKVTDADGNPVSGVTVSFVVASGGGSVGASQPTDVNGFSSAAWTLGTSAGSNTLDATATLAGGSTTVTFSATATAGSAGRLAITTQPSASAANGAVFAQQPVIQLQDQNGNNVTTSNVPITVQQSGGTLGGNTTVLTVNGVATFSGLSLTGLVGNYTLAFTGTNLTGATSNSISLTPGAASALVVVSNPGVTEQSGVAFAQQPVLQVVDASGNAVATSGRAVTAAINSGPGGTVNPSGRQVSTNASGTASFTTLTVTGPVGSYTLLFSSTGLTATSSASFSLTAGAAAQISASSATTQSATVGTAVATPPSVLVVDAVGNPVSGVPVTFAVTAGGGSLNGASQTTDSTGTASLTSWTLGAAVGTNTVTATSAGLTGSPVTFNATGTAGGASTIAINAGNNQSATVNTSVATLPSVKVTDVNSNPVAGVSVTFAVGSGGGSITGATTTTNALGIATVGSWTLGTTAGPNTLTATSGTLSGSPVTFTVTGTAGAAASMALNLGDNQTVTAGQAVPIAPSVLVLDGFGNPKSGTTVTFAVATGGGSVTGGSAVSNASGIATVGSWTLGAAAGSNTLTATSAGLTGSPVTFTATGTAGGATKIALNAGNGQSATVGTTVAVAPSVLVTDAGNNPVANVSVTFAVATGGGSVIGGSATTNASGIASVGSWTLGTTAGTNTLTATSTGLSGSPVTFTATGTAGTPASMNVNAGNGQTATVNTAVATPPSVKILDTFGNPVPNVAVTFAVATGGGSVTLATATTNGAGVGAVGSWILGTTAGSNSLTASSAGLVDVTFTATGVAGAAAQIAINAGDAQSAQVGTAVAVAPQVLVSDAFGNPKSGVGVTFAVAGGGGTVVPTTAITTNASGLATVTSWTLGGAAGTNTLTATATGSGITGNPVTFTATGTSGGPTSVIANSVTTQSATVGTAVAAPPSVLVRDAVNNPVPGVTVTFAITAGPAGVLTGATQTTNASGIATLTSWQLDTTARTNTVTATVTGAGITGNPVTFNATGTAGVATKIIMNRQPSTTVQSGVLFAITPRVQVADQYNNAVATPAPGVVVTASVLTSPGGTPVLTPLTATTATNGLATFTGFTVTGLVGSYTFQFDASASGFGTVASNAVTVTAGPASTLSFTTQPPSNAASGVAFSSPPVLQLRDGAGNAVTTAGIAITATVASGPSGSLTNAIATTNSSGAATFTGLTLTGTAGSYTLSFSGTGLTPVTSTAIALSAGGGSQLGMSTQPSATAVNGQIFAQQPVVQLKDGSGNPVLLAGVSVSVTINSGTGAVLGTTLTEVTNASGQAVFTDLKLTGTTGNFSLLFAASGYVSVGSSTITLTAGAPSTLTITTQPSASAQNTVAFATQPVAVVKDASGNVVPSTGVTATIATGAGTLGGVTTVFTDGAGVATFGNLEITGLIGSRTIKLTAGAANATTSSVTITAGPASGAQSTATVPSGTIGQATSIAVQAKDVSGNLVTSGGATVTISVSGANSAVPAVTDNGNGTYSASYTPNAAGSDNVAILLNGVAISGSPYASTVSATTSTTTLTSISAATTVVGQPFTVNFSVSGAGVTPTGTVTVSDGTGDTCNGSLIGGAGSCQLTATTAGLKTLVGSYGGDANYSGSSSTGSAHTVNAASTTTTITADNPDPSSVGSAYTVDFSVVAVAPGSGTPTGNVTVSDGTDSCTGTVAAGSCQLTSTTSGTKTLVATYAGSSDYATSTSAGVGHTVSSAATTTTLTGHTPSPSVTGQGIVVTYTVTSSGGTPNGGVTVTDGTGGSCTSSVASGTCTIVTTTAGAKSLVATYAGNGNFGGSASTPVAHTVNQASTTTTITSDAPDPSTVGTAYTVSFSVVAVAPGSGTPTGTVTVSDGTDSCNASVAVGSCTITSGTVGTRTLTASYAGDANYAGSSSAGVAHTVGQATSTTTITSDNPDPSVVGQQITVNVTVASAFGTPSGSVSVSDGTDGCSIAALSGGSGSCSYTPSTAGAKTITASYGGDVSHNASSGNTAHQVDPFGAPDAANTTASVPGGNAGSPTTITVQLRDAFGNTITTSGGSIIAGSVVSGPNSGSTLNVTDNGDGTYTLDYTPANGGGDDAIDITLSGNSIGGSPYLSNIP